MEVVILHAEIQSFEEEEDFEGQDPKLAAWTVDLSDEIALAGDHSALLDRLDILFTYGTLSPKTRETILAELIRYRKDFEPDDEDVARMAIYLILFSPDYTIRL